MNNIAPKEDLARALNEQFSGAHAAFVVSYQGTKCEEMKTLRKKLRPAGATMSVIKNTITRRAVQGTTAEKLDALFVGPTAVIWAKDDPVTPAKVLSDFQKESETFKLKGGVVDGALVKPSDIEALAKLPSREELLSQLLALINAPATRLLQTINAPASSLVRTLEAWRHKIEEKGGN